MNGIFIENVLYSFIASIPGVLIALIGVFLSDYLTRSREKEKWEIEFRDNVLIPLISIVSICHDFDKGLRERDMKNQEAFRATYIQYIKLLDDLAIKLRNYIQGVGYYMLSLNKEANKELLKLLVVVDSGVYQFLNTEKFETDDAFYLSNTLTYKELGKLSDLLGRVEIVFPT